MDLTKTEEVVQDTTPRYSGDLGDVETWDELQDKILRVLNYRYNDKDFLYLYYNQDSQNWDSLSLNHSDDEREIEMQVLQDYEELPTLTVRVVPELTVSYSVVPSRQFVETVHIEDNSRLSRMWNFVKRIFSFKSCRKQ